MPPDVFETVRRQLRTVRRRRNLHQLERALYLLIATACGASALIVALAVVGGPLLFAVATWSIAVAIVLAAGSIGVVTRRRWLSAERAPLWIDRRAGLRGRLATLIELERRPAVVSDTFFLPLLRAENLRCVAAWQPERLVPHEVPPAPLAAALAATCVLLGVLFLAPRLTPALRERGQVGPAGRLGGIPRRGPAAAGKSRGWSVVPATPKERAELRWALARLPAALQARLRRELRGEDLGRDAAARPGESGRASSPVGSLEAGDPEERWQVARSPASRSDTGERPGDSAARRRPGGDDGAAPESRSPRRPPAGSHARAGAGEAASGAGSATDPKLFGPPSETPSGRETFELPLGAHVRALAGAPGPASGEAPPAAPDAQPELAPGQRREAPVFKTVVPPAYEPIVRQLFAHRAAEPRP